MKAIQYGIDKETCLVWSRVGAKVALPVLQFDRMVPETNFRTVYELEKMDVIEVIGSLRSVKWTRKVPTAIKNLHRQFWNMKPLGK